MALVYYLKYLMNFSLINLWCVKNLVDSQYLIWKLLQANNVNKEINYFPDPYDEKVEFVFLNTCWFLSSWREEMIEVLNELLENGKKVYLFGCAVQYFEMQVDKNPEYEKEKQEFKKFLEENAWKVFLLSWNDLDFVSVNKLEKWYFSSEFKDFVFPDNIRAYTNAIYAYEYLKIAEWCDNHCSFCIIPKIRWKQKSLPEEKILEQVKNMVESWIKEIIIISQDTTRYWTDIYWEPKLFELLEKIDSLDWDFVYRLLYLYPDILTLEHLKKLTKLEKFLPYFDIPLQHISSNLLKKMWRFYDTDYIYKFLDFIKLNFPNSFIRTNFIIWFPWETEEDFKMLCNFVKKWYFDNIALFEYHDEPLAASSKLPNKIDEKTLHKRFNKISDLVDKELEKKNKARSKQQIWYIMDFDETKLTIRPYLHAPEIDVYDEIDYAQITWIYNDTWEIDLWVMVEYFIK